jgi:essential nuclear protein 1
MPKTTTPTSPGLRQAREARRHNPLSDDILATGVLRQKSGKRKSRPDEDDEARFVDPKSSRRILKIGRDLAEEDLQQRQEPRTALPNIAFSFESRFSGDVEDIDEDLQYDSEVWADEEEEIAEEVVRFLSGRVPA